MKASGLSVWAVDLLRLWYPKDGPSERLCLALGLSRQSVSRYAYNLGITSPDLCAECGQRPRAVGRHRLCNSCQGVRRKDRENGIPELSLSASSPSSPPAATHLRPNHHDEALFSRSSQLAETLSAGPMSGRMLAACGWKETVVEALIEKAPEWYEGNLRCGLLLSVLGRQELLGEAPTVPPDDALRTERDALAGRVEALIAALEVMSKMQAEKGKPVVMSVARRIKRMGDPRQLWLWPELKAELGRAA